MFGFKMPTVEEFVNTVRKLEKWELVKYMLQCHFFYRKMTPHMNALPSDLNDKLLTTGRRCLVNQKVGDTCIIKGKKQVPLSEEKTGTILEIYPRPGFLSGYLVDIGGEKVSSDNLYSEFVGSCIDGVW
jgi:hypothetical protein